MKEVKLPDRVQAALLTYIIHILATIQEYVLKNVLACDIYHHTLLQFDIYAAKKA